MTDINISEIMVSAIVGLIVVELWNFIKRKYAEIQPIKKLRKIKLIKILSFILAYIFPLVTITLLVFSKKTEPTFKNIALFVIICILFIFNILMGHIRSIYKLISELTSKCSQNDSVHKKAINIILEKIKLKERIK